MPERPEVRGLEDLQGKPRNESGLVVCGVALAAALAAGAVLKWGVDQHTLDVRDREEQLYRMPIDPEIRKRARRALDVCMPGEGTLTNLDGPCQEGER